MGRHDIPGASPAALAGMGVALALFLAACGSSGSGSGYGSSGGSPTTQPASAMVTLHAAAHGALGDILIAPSGRTLYKYAPESAGKVACTGACATAWPPFTVQAGAHLVLAGGLAGTLGTVRRPDGTTQVTFGGHPLYYYAGDRSPGETNGEGVMGVWSVISVAMGTGGPTVAGVPPTAAMTTTTTRATATTQWG